MLHQSSIGNIRRLTRRITPRPIARAYERSKERAAEQERLEAMVGPKGVWRESRDFQINFLRRRGFQPSHSVLDIGCGPLRGGLPFIRYLDAGRYTGFDIRSEVVEEAQRQVVKSDLVDKRPEILVSTSFGQEELQGRNYDFVWCFQVFYHLSDELLVACLQRIADYISDTGVCYANVNATHEEGSWKEFPYLLRPIEFYESHAAAYGLSTRNLGRQRDWGYTTKLSGQEDLLLEFQKDR